MFNVMSSIHHPFSLKQRGRKEEEERRRRNSFHSAARVRFSLYRSLAYCTLRTTARAKREGERDREKEKEKSEHD